MPTFERHVARAFACVMLVAGGAHAGGAPDPVATRAGQEANLESTEHRQGLTFALALGPSMTIGGGTGGGGALGLRLGQVIRPNAVALVEATYNGQGHRVMNNLYVNDYTTLMGGLQAWLGPFVYFRVSAGFGSYRCKQCKDPSDSGNIVPVDYVRRGITSAGAVGFEPFRVRNVTIGPAASTVITLTPDGVIVSLTGAIVVSFD